MNTAVLESTTLLHHTLLVRDYNNMSWRDHEHRCAQEYHTAASYRART